MKKAILVILITCSGFFAHSMEIKSSRVKFSPSAIDEVVKLVDKSTLEGLLKKVQVVVEDLGISTDLSSRYKIYLSFSSMAEMGNIHGDFLIGEALSFVSATRKAPGVYEVKSIIYGDLGMQELTQLIDARKMFADEILLRKNCGGEICDHALKTSVVVKSSLKPAK